MYVTWFRHILLCGFMCQIQTHSPTQLAAHVCYPPCLSDKVVLKYNMNSEQNKIRCPRILLFCVFCYKSHPADDLFSQYTVRSVQFFLKDARLNEISLTSVWKYMVAGFLQIWHQNHSLLNINELSDPCHKTTIFCAALMSFANDFFRSPCPETFNGSGPPAKLRSAW